MRLTVRQFTPVLALATLVALVAPLAAQAPATDSTPEHRIRYSVFAGASFSKFVGATADTANLATRTGFLAGASVDYELSPHFGVGVEGRVIQKGAKQLEVSADPGLGYNLTYLDFALVGMYAIAPKATVVPTLFAGPSIGFEMDCKQPVLYNNSAVLQSNCLNNVEREKTEFGFEAGILLTYRFLSVSGQYFRGFKSVVKELDLTHNGFTLTAGVSF